MLVGRWWVVRNDGRRAGRKVQQDPKPQQQIGLPKTAAADWIVHLERGATTTIMGRRNGGEVVMTSERQCCVKNDVW